MQNAKKDWPTMEKIDMVVRDGMQQIAPFFFFTLITPICIAQVNGSKKHYNNYKIDFFPCDLLFNVSL